MHPPQMATNHTFLTVIAAKVGANGDRGTSLGAPLRRSLRPQGGAQSEQSGCARRGQVCYLRRGHVLVLRDVLDPDADLCGAPVDDRPRPQHQALPLLPCAPPCAKHEGAGLGAHQGRQEAPPPLNVKAKPTAKPRTSLNQRPSQRGARSPALVACARTPALFAGARSRSFQCFDTNCLRCREDTPTGISCTCVLCAVCQQVWCQHAQGMVWGAHTAHASKRFRLHHPTDIV